MGLNFKKKNLPKICETWLAQLNPNLKRRVATRSSPRNAVGGGNCLSSSSSSFFFIEFSTRWLNTVIGHETGLASQLILIHPFISHPVHEMLYYTTGVYALYSLRISTDCGVFYVPQESEQWKSCETAPMVFLPYPRRLKKTKMYNCLTICCRCHNKSSTFSSVIGPAGDWTDNLFICSSQKEKTL